MPVKAACTVLVSPLHTAAGPDTVTVEVGRGLMVIVCALAKSFELPAQWVAAPRSTSAESLKVAVEGILGSVLTSVTGRMIVRLEVKSERTSTPLDDQVKFQGPMPVRAA